MFSQVTHGIRISVKSKYVKSFFDGTGWDSLFAYAIHIKNQNEETYQLLRRHWVISDSLNETKIVDGEGVIGKTPTLKPGSAFMYQSHCILKSSMGSMQGYYTMQNVETKELLHIEIPRFPLFSDFIYN